MSCTNHTQPTQQTTESLGGVDVDKNKEPLITYKYLILTPDRQFVSPVSGSLWGDLSMAGVAKDEDATPHWVWSCLSPDNLELKNYQRNDSVLVTLQVWGKVIIGDNGIVRSQHARIIGYGTNDYYLALLYHERVNIQNIKEIVDPKKLIRKVLAT